ncbi:MAG: hypothetical protein ACFFAN_05415 [Promethearchaeota archaeon]
MSIERMFDKLDEKVASLMRSLGLIIALFSGFITLILNYFPLNFFIGLGIILLLVSFLFNIGYTLYLYVITSSNKDDYLYKLDSYRQLIKINQNLHDNIIQDLEYFKSTYEESKDKFLVTQVNKDILEEKYKFELNEENIYHFKTGTVKQFKRNIQAIVDVVNYINVGLEDLLTGEKRRQFTKKLGDYREIIIRYLANLYDYEKLEIAPPTVKIGILSDEIPVVSLISLLQKFRILVEVAYTRNKIKKYDQKKAYENKIKFSYGLFVFNIIISCIFPFIIVIPTLLA